MLTAYCASKLNYNIVLSEKKKIISNQKKAVSDKRTTAIAEGSKVFLESQGLMEYIKDICRANSKYKGYRSNSKIKIRL